MLERWNLVRLMVETMVKTMVLDLYDGGNDGENNGIGFVEISKILLLRTYFSLDQNHLTEDIFLSICNIFGIIPQVSHLSCSDNVVCALYGTLNYTWSISYNAETTLCQLAFILHFSQPGGDIICRIQVT